MMKRAVYLTIVILVALSMQSLAQNTQTRFDDALNASASGNNIAAYDSLRSIEADGYLSGKLYYNLGVISTKLDSLSVAKLYFIAASRYEDTRQSALEGITYLDSRFPQRVAELPRLPWEQFFDWLQRVVGIKMLFWSIVVIANVGVLLYMLGWYIGRPRWLRGAYISAALYVVTFLSFTLYIDSRNQRFEDGVVIAGQFALKELPDPSSAVISQANEGFSFTVDRQRSKQHPGWLYVRMSNGLYGWLPKDALRTI
jgi:hypothetical protein